MTDRVNKTAVQPLDNSPRLKDGRKAGWQHLPRPGSCRDMVRSGTTNYSKSTIANYLYLNDRLHPALIPCIGHGLSIRDALLLAREPKEKQIEIIELMMKVNGEVR